MPEQTKRDLKNIHGRALSAAEKKDSRSRSASRKVKKSAPKELIHDLHVYQNELEMQNDELRRAQSALEESNAKFQDLYDSSPIGYFTVTRDDVIAEVNLTGAGLLGVVRQKLIRQRFRPFVAVGDLDRWNRHITAVFQKGEKMNCNLEIKRADGSTFHACLSCIRMEAGGAQVVRAAVIDISEQFQIENDKQVALEKYRVLFDTFPIGISITDKKGKLIETNKVSEQMLGLSSDEHNKRTVDGPEWKIIRPDGTPLPADEYASVRALKENRKIENVEMGIVKDGGEVTWISVTAVPIPLEQFGVAITYRDITIRKLAEVELMQKNEELIKTKKKLEDVLMTQEHSRLVLLSILEDEKTAWEIMHTSDERYRLLFETMAQGVVFYDRSGTIISANPSAERLLGFTLDQMLGSTSMSPPWRSTHEDGTEFPGEAHPATLALNTGKPVKGVIIGIFNPVEDDHRWFIKDAIPQFHEGDDKPYQVYTTLNDITDIKRAEKAIKESERFATSTVNALDANIAILNESGKIISVNTAWRRFANENAVDPLSVFEGMNYLTVCDSAAGENAEGAAEFAAGIRNVIKGERELYSQEYPCHSPDTKQWFVCRVTRFPGEGPVRVVVAHTNITYRKLAEEAITASLREKEALIKEIHHRVKNNLQVISSLVSLQSSSIQDSYVVNAFQDIQNRIKSMAIIHEKLYQSENLASIEFGDYISSIVESLFRSFNIDPSKIVTRSDIDDISLEIDTAVPCGLIINELITNSLKHAFPDGRNGEIYIAMKRDGDNGYILTVKDNGVGMPENIDLDQTITLGLRLVKILTKQLNGSIEVCGNGGIEFIIQFSNAAV
jgi:PAS domain S-box-containing protein